jgi:hypothetical protein
MSIEQKMKDKKRLNERKRRREENESINDLRKFMYMSKKASKQEVLAAVVRKLHEQDLNNLGVQGAWCGAIEDVEKIFD